MKQKVSRIRSERPIFLISRVLNHSSFGFETFQIHERSLFVSWSGQGVALLYLNRLDEADLSFIKAYRMNSKNVRAKVARGAVAYLKKQYKEAIRIYTANMKLLPKKEKIFYWGSHALNNLGWSYLKTGHYKEALNIFSKLKKYHEKPVYPVVFNGMGWSFYHLKNYQKAENAFIHVLALDPRNSSARYGLLSIPRQKG